MKAIPYTSSASRPASRARRLLTVAVAGTFAVLGLAAGTGTAHAAGTTYYVAAAGGSNSRVGTSPSKAFKTVSKCAAVAVAGDTCVIESGDYPETVTPARSGTASAPITFEAAPGADVTVDGTNAVTGWTLDSGHVYKAPVTLAGSAAAEYSSTEYPGDSDLWANQVFTSGSLVPEASYPPASSNPWAGAYVTSGWTSTSSGSGGTCATPPCTSVLSGTLSYPGFPALGDMTGATVVLAGAWVSDSATVTSGDLNGSNTTLNLSFPGSDAHNELGGASPDFRLVGKKSLLTGPDAWFYDASAHELYMWASNGGVPTGVTAKARNYGFDLDGRSHVTVQGINLLATTVTTDGSSAGNVLDHIDAQYTSTWQTSQYDSSLAYDGVYDANHYFDSGILLHGSGNTLSNSTVNNSMGNGVSVDGTGNTVTDDLITNTSYGGSYTAAVALVVGSSGTTITHDTMYATGRDVVNMNTNLYPTSGFQNERIAYNDMYDYARIDSDLGAVYACCNDALTGTRIDHNWLHDPAQAGNGIHLDNGSYDLGIDHNVIWDLGGGNGINFGGFAQSGEPLPYLTGSVTNNTIVSGGGQTVFEYYADAAQVPDTVLRNNILDGAHPSGQSFDYIAGGTPDETDDLVTTESDGGGTPDPLFTRPATGDFTLRTGSPAVDAGTEVPGITDGYAGSAPDQGAYESTQSPWVPGCGFTGCVASTGSPVQLLSRQTGLVADIAGSSTDSGADAVQNPASTATSQQFTVFDLGTGYVRLIDGNSGQCLDVSGGSQSAGAPVIQWPCGDQLNQQWQTAGLAGGYEHLVNRNSGQCLDVSGASTAAGTQLIQWTCGTQLNQQWTEHATS